ncbi:cation diffusion facilitator family transporter [Sphingopyxis terrae]|uniref:cation diffusion facilitator family transporter n=1 Tax=Sphingopyxis terrae TaxID=33052 RepID=UPI00361F42B5
MIQPVTQEDGRTHGAHDHAAGARSRSLAIALALTALFLIAELVGAWLFNSLALLSDAAHMFTDTAALALALVAVRMGRKPADARRTYGYRRVEILAAAFNALLLLAIAAYVLMAGARRFFAPEDVGSIGMLAVAAVGLAVNLVAMRVLAHGTQASLNVKGAYLEVWADMLGSFGVIGAAGLIWLTDGAGLTRWSQLQSGSGSFRAPGYCCAMRPTSCCRASRAASTSTRSARKSWLAAGWMRSMSFISGRSRETT